MEGEISQALKVLERKLLSRDLCPVAGTALGTGEAWVARSGQNRGWQLGERPVLD